ncbi:hypothetical protein PIB30_028910 [Stylosanthes scabra]|uniref:Uncharacterized protein n=1 Tax=Stylosanthes scabra TaxID=79078 RepID=A0ABU6Z9V1_9FABA|nr:hypothetical protein [Stylosanthes scabra]
MDWQSWSLVVKSRRWSHPHQEVFPTSPPSRISTAVRPTPHHPIPLRLTIESSRLFALSLSRPPLSPPFSSDPLSLFISSSAAAVEICSANVFWSCDLSLCGALPCSSPLTLSGLTSSPQLGAPSCRHPKALPDQLKVVVAVTNYGLCFMKQQGWRCRGRRDGNIGRKRLGCGNALLEKGRGY